MLLDVGYSSSFHAAKKKIQFPACPCNREWVKLIFMSPFNNWGYFPTGEQSLCRVV
jgi:hypothetical protein